MYLPLSGSVCSDMTVKMVHFAPFNTTVALEQLDSLKHLHSLLVWVALDCS